MAQEKKRRNLIIVAILVIANVVFFVNLVSNDKKPDQPLSSNIEDGKTLAVQYCQSCHQLPDPSLLSKQIWIEGALPTMGPFFGINSFKGLKYHQIKDVDAANFPNKPTLDSVQWQKICDYYYNTAPEFLPQQEKDITKVKVLDFFTVELPKNQDVFGKDLMATYIKIDTTVSTRRIIVNNAFAQKLYIFDNKLNLLSANRSMGLITDIDFQKGQILACSLGESVEGNNQSKGNVSSIEIGQKGSVTKGKMIFDKLARPVKLTHADLNNDGKMDYLISQFGNMIGDLSWMKNNGNNTYDKIILKNTPGALNTIVRDDNKDGLNDVWALFSDRCGLYGVGCRGC
ncbi:MAG: VCBS repeat-containing protein [Flavobacterium sp.]|nr:MAG: VCBS repeat-containing protein [Flavobacterium sp.]